MGLVYSTEGGRMCPQCRHPVAACQLQGRAAASRRRRHRARQPRDQGPRRQGGDAGARCCRSNADALAALGKQLRNACGAGGTLKDGVLEVQGDHVERVMQLLQQQGWTVKRAGG